MAPTYLREAFFKSYSLPFIPPLEHTQLLLSSLSWLVSPNWPSVTFSNRERGISTLCPLELSFSQKLKLNGLSFFVFFLGAEGKWQQPEDVAVAGHKVTQKGKPQNIPKGRIRRAPMVQPAPAEEPIPHQERQS